MVNFIQAILPLIGLIILVFGWIPILGGFSYGLTSKFKASKIPVKSLKFNLIVGIITYALIRLLQLSLESAGSGKEVIKTEISYFFIVTITMAFCSLFGMAMGILIRKLFKR